MKEVDIEGAKNYLYARDDLAAAYLFGSYGSGSSWAGDVDIAVLMSRGIDHSGLCRAEQRACRI